MSPGTEKRLQIPASARFLGGRGVPLMWEGGPDLHGGVRHCVGIEEQAGRIRTLRLGCFPPAVKPLSQRFNHIHCHRITEFPFGGWKIWQTARIN